MLSFKSKNTCAFGPLEVGAYYPVSGESRKLFWGRLKVLNNNNNFILILKRYT